MSESEINQWTVDFAQAKIAIRNLELLVQSLQATQTEAVGKLKSLFTAYSRFAENGTTSKRNAEVLEQIKLLTRIEQNMHLSTAKFCGKAKAQLEAARTQVSALHTTLSKMRSLKGPQYMETAEKLAQQVPSFLDLFDAFLARFTLQVRLQQADFYKQWGDAFTHAGHAEPIEEIEVSWRTEFDKIMPALEVMKSVNPHVKNSSLLGTTATSGPGGHIHEEDPAASRLGHTAEKVDSVIFAPVKWIHSKMGPEIKHVKFSDPRMGFFTKSTHPPAHDEETAVAAYDFEGQSESDLTFKQGDVIKIIDKGTEDDPNWWCGEFNGKRGLFPCNYLVDEEDKDEQRDPDEYVPKVVETEEEDEDAPALPKRPKRPEPLDTVELEGEAEAAKPDTEPKEEPTEEASPKLPKRPTSKHIESLDGFKEVDLETAATGAPAETAPETLPETAPLEIKPVEAEPEAEPEVKPLETEPEAKPLETEAKPLETEAKPLATEPLEIKHASESTTQEEHVDASKEEHLVADSADPNDEADVDELSGLLKEKANLGEAERETPAKEQTRPVSGAGTDSSVDEMLAKVKADFDASQSEEKPTPSDADELL